MFIVRIKIGESISELYKCQRHWPISIANNGPNDKRLKLMPYLDGGMNLCLAFASAIFYKEKFNLKMEQARDRELVEKKTGEKRQKN